MIQCYTKNCGNMERRNSSHLLEISSGGPNFKTRKRCLAGRVIQAYCTDNADCGRYWKEWSLIDWCKNWRGMVGLLQYKVVFTEGGTPWTMLSLDADKEGVVMMFLDIEKAYDMLWKEG